MGDGPGPQSSPSGIRGGGSFFLTLVVVIVVGAVGGYALGRYVFDRLVQTPSTRLASPEDRTGPLEAAPAPPAVGAGEPALSGGTQALSPIREGPARAGGPPAGKASGQASRATAPVAGSGAAFFVQAGAFGSAQRAEALADKLRQQGFPVTVETVNGKQPLYKVRLGPYSRREDAQKALQQLKPTVPDAFIP